MNKIDYHKSICDHIHEVYMAKNHDYGDSFGKSIAGVVRMEDTLLDLANYAIMLNMELGDSKWFECVRT